MRLLGKNYGLGFLRDPAGKWHPVAVDYTKEKFDAQGGTYNIVSSLVENWQGIPALLYIKGNPEPVNFAKYGEPVTWSAERTKTLIKSQHRLAQLLAANSFQLLLLAIAGLSLLGLLAGGASYWQSGASANACKASQATCQLVVDKVINLTVMR